MDMLADVDGERSAELVPAELLHMWSKAISAALHAEPEQLFY